MSAPLQNCNNNATTQTRLDLDTPEAMQNGCLAVDALRRFRADEKTIAIPVVNAQLQPVGLVTRRQTLAVFGHQFSYELNSRKRVDILLAEQPLIFDINTDLNTLSRAMTERDQSSAFDPAIMTANGIYIGLLSVITLLKQMTDIRLELAFDSNPLSRLPGNNSINRETDARLRQGKPFMLVYADLDHFKAFNDHYGYERGDRVIQLLAQLLKHVAGKEDFIGHVGGDDFVLLLAPEGWRDKATALLDAFSRESALMYDNEDRQRGYIIAENRQGERMHFSMMSLSLAIIPCDADAYASHVAVAEAASEVKHLAKMQAGNCMVVNRRAAAPDKTVASPASQPTTPSQRAEACNAG